MLCHQFRRNVESVPSDEREEYKDAGLFNYGRESLCAEVNCLRLVYQRNDHTCLRCLATDYCSATCRAANHKEHKEKRCFPRVCVRFWNDREDPLSKTWYVSFFDDIFK